MSMVSSYALKDKKCISVNIYSNDAAVILRDFLIKAVNKGMEEGKFFEAEVALHDANELTAAMEEAFE
nr:MAG TPA: hypothetical protein [Bacteriophage sp.]